MGLCHAFLLRCSHGAPDAQLFVRAIGFTRKNKFIFQFLYCCIPNFHPKPVSRCSRWYGSRHKRETKASHKIHISFRGCHFRQPRRTNLKVTLCRPSSCILIPLFEYGNHIPSPSVSLQIFFVER